MWPSGQSSHLEVPSKIVGLDMSMVVDGTNDTTSQNRITIFRYSLKQKKTQL